MTCDRYGRDSASLPSWRVGRAGGQEPAGGRGRRHPVETHETLVQPTRQTRIRARPLRSPAVGVDSLVLGRYRVIRRLGAGGFGVVWEARDESLGREVALKQVPLAPDGDHERAAREALAAARLSHPAIVALYEADWDGDHLYLVSELVRGVTLAERIAARDVEDRELLAIALALVGALEHAHGRGVIHRDVKPGNVMIPDRAPDRAGIAKLTDFGGARLTGDDGLTRTGDVVGTLAYMAPEQADGHPVHEPADLYSLALIIYEALAGTNPVRGHGPADTARRVGRRLPPLARWRRDLDPALCRALDTALDPRPDRRGTLGELRLAVAGALAADPAPATAAPRRSGRRRERARPAPRPAEPAPQAGETAARERLAPRPRLAGALCAALVVAGTLLGLGATQGLNPLIVAAAVGVAIALLPRAGWLAAAIALVAWEAAAGQPGSALLLAAAALPVPPLLMTRGSEWSLAGLSPALGLITLAGAFPALAGQARSVARRAALGAAGYWWLLLAEVLSGRRLWLGAPAGVPPRSSWDGSVTAAAAHALGPVLRLSTVLGLVAWAAAAAALPLLVRGRVLVADAALALLWAGALVLASERIATAAGSGLSPSLPAGGVLEALVAAAVAVAGQRVYGRLSRSMAAQ